MSKEEILKATKKMWKEWEVLDNPQEPSYDLLESLNDIDDLITQDSDNITSEVKIRKSIERKTRERNDLGNIIFTEIVIKKLEIIDNYNSYSQKLKSIAYYQLFPIMDAQKPIAQILRWTVSHYPSWVIWFTSPLAKGIKSRTGGEYIIVHTLNEKEAEDHELLVRFNKFPCFGRKEGIDILLGFEKLDDAMQFVEEYLPTIINKDLYGDRNFLRFLNEYQETVISNLLEE
ncbi:MAG: hypothetical protein ACFFDT_39440 [Candidatus Hodarchaeota archaeon]